jgi:hypothetical protein
MSTMFTDRALAPEFRRRTTDLSALRTVYGLNTDVFFMAVELLYI